MAICVAAALRVFFHLEVEGEQVTDDDGCDCVDLDAARKLATTAAVDIAADDLRRGLPEVAQRVVVTDATGRELLGVIIEARVRLQA